jgi:hypothetical protein
MKNIKIKRRFPNYFSGFEETEHFIDSREELEKIGWVNDVINNKSFYCLGISKSERNSHLMVLNNYDVNYGGCKSYWVIGYISGENIDDLNLPDYIDLCGDHKDGCRQKNWQHSKCSCGLR